MTNFTGQTPGSKDYLNTQYQANMPQQNLVNQNQFKPTERSFDGSRYGMTNDQTVEHRLEGILSKESPLMQRAQTQGMQYGNSRGLLNSSMAAGAAQGAMIDRATPIAQQDAQQFFERGNLSLNHQNQHDMAYLNDDLQRNQMALQQAIQQGNDQLAAQLRMQINEQQEHLSRGSMQLGHGQTMQRDNTLHGYNREQDAWRHGQTLDRDSIQQGYHQDNMHLGHGFNREQDSWRQGYHQDNMRLGHTQDMTRDQASYNHQRTMTELGHVLGMENMEFAKNLDQRHQIQLLEIGQDFQRLGQYESGLTNVWNGMLNMMTQSGATTPEQYQHLMNQMMPIMNNTRDFYSSLYGKMGTK